MPRLDGTGPMGMGPMTGRGAGICAGGTAKAYGTPVGGQGGLGCGRKRGCGYRRMFYATGVPGWLRNDAFAAAQAGEGQLEEKAALKNQADFLENQLKQVKNRLAGLEKDAE